MNRRNMLKSLAAIFAASFAPALFIPKFEPVRWKIYAPTRGMSCTSFSEFLRSRTEAFDERILKVDYITDWIEAVKLEYPELMACAFLPRS